MLGLFDTFEWNMNGINHSSTWTSTLVVLRDQKQYLEGLLSNTATTLNALRDKQSRYERALSNNQTAPRSKKKKIQHSKWRTGKTIEICENEERILVDCLQVCQNSIHTLETICNPGHYSSTAAVLATTPSPVTYSTSATTDFEWSRWPDNQDRSQFPKGSRICGIPHEIPPEVTDVTDFYIKRRSPLPPRSQNSQAAVPPVPPNSAFEPAFKTEKSSTLSPKAAVFEPSAIQYVKEDDSAYADLDKLTISGLLAPNYMPETTLKRRFSDTAVDQLFDRLRTSPAV
ncbi:hypothetical protein GQ43DRAFT_278625 [Delitschia confertaspora ATCC 74209]|uniref:Uncharacterized protein n=1 Tax=Delitschia confertaspora ATCC 74209 TaxID=1513339 RepID=A0A9P4JRT9_9PLEO|nr:hypothetical protein GQ43DRAFT_278625 [Delitschia confertaspora ATCC 74209]